MGMLLTFSACKKNKDVTPNNSFVISNTNYAANLGYYAAYGSGAETDLIFVNKAITPGANGLNTAWFAFGGSVPAAGTYTYKSGTIDPAKNFSDVIISYNSSVSATTGDVTGGTVYDSDSYDASGSTITISVSGNTYTVVYSLKFTDASKNITIVNGQFTGTLTKLN
jgi:hypothetical protein